MKHIDIVDNGLKAVEVSGDTSYDVILMDIEMDGLEAVSTIVERCQQLASRDRAKIFFVTAHAVDGTRLNDAVRMV